jgi:hypothetical protein
MKLFLLISSEDTMQQDEVNMLPFEPSFGEKLYA